MRDDLEHTLSAVRFSTPFTLYIALLSGAVYDVGEFGLGLIFSPIILVDCGCAYCISRQRFQTLNVPLRIYIVADKRTRFTTVISKCHRSPFISGLLLHFWASVCKNSSSYAIRPMSVLSVLSVTLVYCGQTVGWIKMKLDVQISLGPGHIVLDADPAPPPPKRHSLQLSADICCGQMAG